MMAQQIRVRRRPQGLPKADDFMTSVAAVPAPRDGEVLLETLYLSLDPYMRGLLGGRHLTTIEVGDVMVGEVVARVAESRASDFTPGMLVVAKTGWQTYAVAAGATVRAIPADLDPPSFALGVLGLPGLTAYAGLSRLAELRAGDTVLVSAASGAVGATVVQMAKLKGCRVIGIAGSAEKCAWVREVAGAAGCINYKTEDLRISLRRLCPQGIDVYFDNVGGVVLQAALEQLAVGARVVLCGLIDQYNSAVPPPGPNPGLIIKARATVRGLVVYDHLDLFPAFEEEVGGWLRSGRMTAKEDVTEGFIRTPETFARLMAGGNFGKTLIRVA